jgi:hypothetical protein
VWDLRKDKDSIWELARLNFPDIACYAIPTLAACQIVLKATEGVFLHNLLAWSTHLSRFVGPFWFILLRQTTVTHIHIKSEQSKTLASFRTRILTVNKPAQMCVNMKQVRSCGFHFQGLLRFSWIETAGAPYLAHMYVMLVNWFLRGLWQLHYSGRHLIAFLFLVLRSTVQIEPESFWVQTCPDVRKRYVPECPAQVGIECACGQLYVCIYTRESVWNSDTNTLEPGRPQHDRPAAFVIAQ